MENGFPVIKAYWRFGDTDGLCLAKSTPDGQRTQEWRLPVAVSPIVVGLKAGQRNFAHRNAAPHARMGMDARAQNRDGDR